MRRRLSIPAHSAATHVVAALAACLLGLICQAQAPATPAPSSGVVLDRVVAVVNRHAILASDLDDEIRLSVLDPNSAGISLTRQRALEQLISRTLIEQQIGQEDAQAAQPSQAEVDARLSEIRKELPACMRENCATDAGWNAFLTAHDLTAERVVSYLRYRLEILRFIEQRFRQGIRISQQDVATYYHDTLLPQYPQGQTAPPLDQVAPRIEEILLQQQVNALFDSWLTNLRQEGDVEVLDPSLESQKTPSADSAETGLPGQAAVKAPDKSPNRGANP
ncbi:MAG TPA: hypothetical protein VL991_02990 [Terracidiphilus sp.]|nr:hypothetical protein [Terracidiphilus sp.]